MATEGRRYMDRNRDGSLMRGRIGGGKRGAVRAEQRGLTSYSNGEARPGGDKLRPYKFKIEIDCGAIRQRFCCVRAMYEVAGLGAPVDESRLDMSPFGHSTVPPPASRLDSRRGGFFSAALLRSGPSFRPACDR